MPFPLAELVAGDLEKAAAYLAERRETVCHQGRTWTEKQADGISDVLSSLGDKVTKNPVLGKALLGGGLGTLVGGAAHFMGGDEQDPKAKRRGILSSALTGGLAGAALGGGVGLVQKNLGGGGGGGVGGGGGSGGAGNTPNSSSTRTPLGEFFLGGHHYRVDPQLLRDRPHLLDQANALASGPGMTESLLPAAVHGFWNNPIAPLSARGLPVVGAMDAVLSRGRQRVQDLGGGLRHMLEKAKSFPSTVPNQEAYDQLASSNSSLREVLQGRGPEPLAPGASMARRAMRKGRVAGRSVLDMFRRAFGGVKGDYTPGNLMQMHEVPATIEPVALNPSAATPTGGTVPTKTRVPVMRPEPLPPGIHGPTNPQLRPVPQTISKDVLNEAINVGRLNRQGLKLSLPRLGGRALLYGGLPLLEWGTRAYLGERAKAQDIRALMNEHAQRLS